MRKYIYFPRAYATAWEGSIGPWSMRFSFPRYWLYSRNRAKFIQENPESAFAKRAWLFANPLSFYYDNEYRNEGE